MNRFAVLFLLFVGTPLLEIYLLIKVGSVIGALPTVLVLIMTAVIGAWMLRIQGFSTLMRVRQALANGALPTLEVLEGLVLLGAGLLLLTPGFFTDAIGFLCLVPELRRQFVLWLSRKWLVSMASRQTFRQETGRDPSQPSSPHRIIEGEFRREQDRHK